MNRFAVGLPLQASAGFDANAPYLAQEALSLDGGEVLDSYTDPSSVVLASAGSAEPEPAVLALHAAEAPISQSLVVAAPRRSSPVRSDWGLAPLFSILLCFGALSASGCQNQADPTTNPHAAVSVMPEGLDNAHTLEESFRVFFPDAPMPTYAATTVDISSMEGPVYDLFINELQRDYPELYAEWQREVLPLVEYFRRQGNSDGNPDRITVDEFQARFGAEEMIEKGTELRALQVAERIVKQYGHDMADSALASDAWEAREDHDPTTPYELYLALIFLLGVIAMGGSLVSTRRQMRSTLSDIAERDRSLQERDRQIAEHAEAKAEAQAQVAAAQILLRDTDALMAQFSNGRGVPGKMADIERQLAALKPYIARFEDLEQQVAMGLLHKGQLSAAKARYETILAEINAARAAIEAEKDKVTGNRSRLVEEIERLERLEEEYRVLRETHPPEIVRAEQKQIQRKLAKLLAAIAELDLIHITLRQTRDEHGDVAAKIEGSNRALDKLNALIRQFAELTTQYETLLGENPDMAARIDGLRGQLQTLQSQIQTRDGLLSQIAKLEKANPQLADQIRSLTADEQRLTDEARTLGDARDKVNAQVEELTTQNAQITAHIESLEKELEIDQGKEREFEALKLSREAEQLALRTRIGEATERKGVIDAAIAAATQEIETLDVQVEVADQRQSELQESVDALLAEKHGLEDVIEGLEASEAEVNAGIEAATTRQEALREEIITQEGQRDEAQAEQGRLTEERDELRDETIPQIEASLAETLSEAEGFRSEREEKAELLETAKQRRDGLVGEVNELEAKIGATQVRVETLQSDLATKQATQEGLEETERDLQANIQRAEETIQRLRVSIEGRCAVAGEETLVEQQTAIRGELVLIGQRLEAGDIGEDEAERERTPLRARADLLRNDILEGRDGLQAKRDELLEVISDLQAHHAELEQQIATLESEKEEAKAKKAGLDDDLQSEQVYRDLQETELEDLEGQKAAALEAKAEFEGNIVAANTAIGELGEEKITLTADLEAAELQRAEAQVQKEGVEEKLREARQAAIRLTEELGTQRAALKTAEEERDRAQAELGEVSGGIEAIRTAHEEITTQMAACHALAQEHDEALAGVATLLEARDEETLPEAIEAARVSLEALRSQVEELNRLEGEREELRSQHRRISKRITALKERIGEARGRKKNADDRIKELERSEQGIIAEVERSESRIADLEVLHQQRDELRTRIGGLQPRHEVEAEIELLETEYSELENYLLPKMRVLRSHIQELRASHGNIEEEIASLEQTEREELERQTELAGVVDEKETHLEEIRGQISELKGQRDAVEEDIELHQSLLEEAQGLAARKEDLQAKVREATAERDEANQAVMAAEALNTELEEQTAGFRAELETLEQTYGDLQAARRAAEQAIAAAQATDHEIRIEPIAFDYGQQIELRIPVGMTTLNIQRRRRGESDMHIHYADGEGSLEIDSETVSRNHAQITRGDDGSYEIVDLGSANGTFIRRGGIIRHQVAGEPEKLLLYDVLMIGEQELKIMELPGGGDDGSGVRRSGGSHSAASGAEGTSAREERGSGTADRLGQQLRLVDRELRELGQRRAAYLDKEDAAGSEDQRAQIAGERYKTVESLYVIRSVERVLLAGDNSRIAFEVNRDNSGKGFLTISIRDESYYLYPRDAIGIEGTIETALELVPPTQRGLIDQLATQFSTALAMARETKVEPEEPTDEVPQFRLFGTVQLYVKSLEERDYNGKPHVRIQLRSPYQLHDGSKITNKLALALECFGSKPINIPIQDQQGKPVAVLAGKADEHGIVFSIEPLDMSDELEPIPDVVIMRGLVDDLTAIPMHVVAATSEMGEYAMTTTQGDGYKIKGKVVNQDGVAAVYDQNNDLHLLDVDQAGGHGDANDNGARLSLEHFTATVETSVINVAEAGLTAAHEAILTYNKDHNSDVMAAATALHIKKPEAANQPYRALFNWLGDTRGVIYPRRRRVKEVSWGYRTVDQGYANLMVQPGKDFQVGGEGRTLAIQLFQGANFITSALGMPAGPDEDEESGLKIRRTEHGVVPDPDPQSQDGRLPATEYADGVPLGLNDIVVLGSDGFWENFGSLEMIYEIIGGCTTLEEMMQTLTREAHYRMSFHVMAKKKIPVGDTTSRMEFTYGKDRTFYIDRKGRVFASAIGGEAIARFKSDNFSLMIYRHNPTSLADAA